MAPPDTVFSNAEIPPPSVRAIPFSHHADVATVELLSPEEQAELAAISSVIRVRRNTLIYPEGGPARFVYNIVSGLVQTYHLLSDGTRRITTFLFPADLFGLAEEGRYVTTAQSVTPLIAYRIPLEALERIIQRDPRLDAALLCKLCHELRHAERHAIIASQRDARARVSAFLLSLHDRKTIDEDSDLVAIPMIRHDIADYLGLTPEAVSRSLHDLEVDRLLFRQAPRMLRLLNIPMLRRLARQA